MSEQPCYTADKEFQSKEQNNLLYRTQSNPSPSSAAKSTVKLLRNSPLPAMQPILIKASFKLVVFPLSA